MRETWALLPLKRLDRAKQRLAPVLDSGMRRSLVLAMVKDVLSALSGVVGITRILLVSSEPEAGYLFQSGKLEVFYSAQNEGMNRELEHAAAYAEARGAERALIVHGDLPFLTPEVLDEFLSGGPALRLRAAACKHGSGTNLLLTPLPLAIPLVFGRGSLKRFLQHAETSGRSLDVVRDPRLARDIDDPDDFQRLGDDQRPLTDAGLVLQPGPSTRAFMERFAHLQAKRAPGQTRQVQRQSPGS